MRARARRPARRPARAPQPTRGGREHGVLHDERGHGSGAGAGHGHGRPRARARRAPARAPLLLTTGSRRPNGGARRRKSRRCDRWLGREAREPGQSAAHQELEVVAGEAWGARQQRNGRRPDFGKKSAIRLLPGFLASTAQRGGRGRHGEVVGDVHGKGRASRGCARRAAMVSCGGGGPW